VTLLFAPESTRQRQTAGWSLVAAILLLGYLHLKLSVSASERNRLNALKGKPASEEDVQNYDDQQAEQLQVGELLVLAGALSADELSQAHDLSKATHRLLGDCCVSFDWISEEGVQAAIAIRREWKQGKLNQQQVYEQLKGLRLTEDQVQERHAQRREAPNAVSLTKNNYKDLFAKSKEVKAARAAKAAQAKEEEDILAAASDSDLATDAASVTPAGTRFADTYMQNDETRALVQRMNAADAEHALFKSAPKAVKPALFKAPRAAKPAVSVDSVPVASVEANKPTPTTKAEDNASTGKAKSRAKSP
jgi:type III secretory pathway component EscV